MEGRGRIFESLKLTSLVYKAVNNDRLCLKTRVTVKTDTKSSSLIPHVHSGMLFTCTPSQYTHNEIQEEKPNIYPPTHNLSELINKTSKVVCCEINTKISVVSYINNENL